MSTIAEHLMAALTTRLDDDLTSPLERDRVIDLEADDLPSKVLNWILDAPRERPGVAANELIDHRQLTVLFAVRVEAASGQKVSTVAEAESASVVKNVCGPAGAESPFHHLAHRIRMGKRQLILGKGNPPIGLLVMELLCDYQTRVTDAEAWA